MEKLRIKRKKEGKKNKMKTMLIVVMMVVYKDELFLFEKMFLFDSLE